MTTWSKDELQRMAETDDLHIAPFREDGKIASMRAFWSFDAMRPATPED